MCCNRVSGTAARHGQRLFGRTPVVAHQKRHRSLPGNSIEVAPSITTTSDRSMSTLTRGHCATTSDSASSRFATLAAESSLTSSRTSASVPSHTSSSLHEQHSSVDFHHHQHDHNNNHYYSTSSFEAALNQVLELERDAPGSDSSHHQSMESCLRDFFRV